MSRKISQYDEGELNIAVATDMDNQVVRIQFPKPIKWLALEYDEAMELVKLLTRKASELKSDKN